MTAMNYGLAASLWYVRLFSVMLVDNADLQVTRWESCSRVRCFGVQQLFYRHLFTSAWRWFHVCGKVGYIMFPISSSVIVLTGWPA